MITLTMVASNHKLHPAICGKEQANAGACIKASGLQMGILYLALSLMATGSGGIRPCVAPFGASQFDQSHPEEKKQLKHYFNWYYFAVTFASLIAVTLIVYVQDNIGWALGFGIPTIVFVLSIVFFFGGMSLYRYSPPRGSAFTGLAQVIVAAVWKRNLPLPEDPSKLYLSNTQEKGEEFKTGCATDVVEGKELKKSTGDNFDESFKKRYQCVDDVNWTVDYRNLGVGEGQPAVVVATSCDEKLCTEDEANTENAAQPDPEQSTPSSTVQKTFKVSNAGTTDENFDLRKKVNAKVYDDGPGFEKTREAVAVGPHDEEDDDYNRVVLRHSDQFRFLDKAAIEVPEDWTKVVGKDGQILKTANPWRLSSVQHVEELKCLVRLLPMMATLIPLHMATAQGHTYVIQQANTMDRHLGKHFTVPAASMATISILTVLLWIPFFDKKVVPFLRKYTGEERGITFLQKIGVGTGLQILVELVKVLVERRRRDAAIHYGLVNRPYDMIPISAFWLVPQFVLGGLAESFLMVGHLEFFYFLLPEHMTSTGSALVMAAHAIGASLSTVLLHFTQQVTARPGHPGWLDNNINKAHLDYFYGLLTVWLALNFVFFLMVARWYKRHQHQNQMMLNNVDLYRKAKA
ncbi:unnamed protein product [Calypogeia fissa]